MRILGIETSGVGSQVGLAEADVLRCRWQDAVGRRHARELVPGIQRLLAETGWRPRDLDLVAVSVGPGSYTGLRVGITCAKTLAYAAQLDVLGIGTPETIAANAPPDVERVTVVIDAQRGQVYATEFRRDAEGALRDLGKGTVIVSADRWAIELEQGSYVLGPALDRYGGLVPARCQIGAETQWHPRIETLIRLARLDYQGGRRTDLNELAPRYLRKCAAEEQWEERRHPSAEDVRGAQEHRPDERTT